VPMPVTRLQEPTAQCSRLGAIARSSGSEGPRHGVTQAGRSPERGDAALQILCPASRPRLLESVQRRRAVTSQAAVPIP